jgi:hypothetical protein
MRMNRIAALTLSAGMITMAACSDSPTSPTTNVVVPKSNFAVGDITDTPAPEAAPGVIIVCKTGNIGGSFTFGRTTEGPAVDPTASVASDQTIANGKCLEVARDDSPSGSGSHITITEGPAADPANTVQSITACRFRGYALDGVTLMDPEDCVYADGGDLFLNHFHGYVITYNNVYTPPQTSGCTYTQGYWKTHGPTPKGNNKNEWDLATITLGTVNYTQAQAQSIFNKAPAGNGLISLAHQLMAAKLNLANGAVDPSIAATITAADALIGGLVVPPVGSGYLSPASVSALVTALTNFNEGATGPGHCGDEIL